MARNRKLKPLQDLPGLFDEFGLNTHNTDTEINFMSAGAKYVKQKETPKVTQSEVQPLKKISRHSNLKFISLNGSKVDDKKEYIEKIKFQNDRIKIEFKDDNRPIE